jgi:hypothetical protein
MPKLPATTPTRNEELRAPLERADRNGVGRAYADVAASLHPPKSDELRSA